MPKIKMSPNLKGRFSSVIFEEMCIEKEYAWIKCEDIYSYFTPNNILTFKFKFQRIQVLIPTSISKELWIMCRPSNNKETSPSFTLDYLTLNLSENHFKLVGEGDDAVWVQKDITEQLPARLFTWVEVKTKGSELTDNQHQFFFDYDADICKTIYTVDFDFPNESFILDNAMKKVKGKASIIEDKLP